MDEKVEQKRKEALNRALQQVEKAYGKGAIMRLDKMDAEIEGLSTGALSLDLALGGRGLPRGRIIELFGPESSGKTTLALHVTAEAQKLGGVAAVIDAEHAMDPVWAKKCGVDVGNLLVSQPESGEEALEITEMLVRSGALSLIIIDSVASLIPRAEIDGAMGDAHVALQARLMSQAMRKLTGVISKTNTIVIFINQIRMRIGVMFGNPETTPGGRALKFYSSIRLDIRRISAIKEGDVVIGSHVRTKVVKNKVAAPFRQAEFDIMFDSGISREGDILDLALEDEIAQKSGAWFSYKTARLGQGRENSKQFLKDNPDVLADMHEAVLRKRAPHLFEERETKPKETDKKTIAATKRAAAPTKMPAAARKRA